MKLIKLYKRLIEGFDKWEENDIVDAVQNWFDEKGNNGLRNSDILNSYLGKLEFEVDVADIEISSWQARHSDRSQKRATISVQGNIIGQINN